MSIILLLFHKRKYVYCINVHHKYTEEGTSCSIETLHQANASLILSLLCSRKKSSSCKCSSMLTLCETQSLIKMLGYQLGI